MRVLGRVGAGTVKQGKIVGVEKYKWGWRSKWRRARGEGQPKLRTCEKTVSKLITLKAN